MKKQKPKKKTSMVHYKYTQTKPQGLIQWISSWKLPFCQYQHAFHLSMPWSYYVTSQREFNSPLGIGH